MRRSLVLIVLVAACGSRAQPAPPAAPPANHTERTPPASTTAAAAPVASCQEVVDSTLQLYLAGVDKQYAGASQADIDAVVASLKEKLPQMETDAIATCERDQWTDEQRLCVLAAPDIDSAMKCE